jgi:hypothetical protein
MIRLLEKCAPLALTAVLGLGAAQAQTVWRCGGERPVYTNEPCAGGALVQVADERSAQQRDDAARVAARDAAAAERLTRERQQREALLKPAAAAGIGVAAADLKPRLPPPAAREAKRPQGKARRSAASANTSPSTARATRLARG